MSEEIQRIAARIEEILANKNNEPLDVLGSYIVGATLVRDDIEPHFKAFPLLEKIAELGADLETLAGSEHAEVVFAEIQDAFASLKSQFEAQQPL